MDIKKDKNIWKFSFYGFFKNLKFFEPFLYVFFVKIGFSFLQIGALISIREIVMNIFEVPSGVFADNYGREKTLQICFILYIISFIVFFIGSDFLVITVAMVFFGLGEAFRSGTHKAIIFSYLDRNELLDRKVEVYGRTKGFSLLGSALSAIIGTFIVFVRSNYRLVFLFSIIPYLIDFFLINSYPEYLDGGSGKRISFKLMLTAARASLVNLKNIINLRRGLVNSSIYDGYFKVLKDYLQPILKAEIVGIAILTIAKSEEQSLSILLGLSYFIIYLLSALSSRNAHQVRRYFADWDQALNRIYLYTALILGLIGMLVFKNRMILVIMLYVFVYVLRNIRRPIMLNYISNVINKEERATMLSIESQFTTIIVIVMAPILGFIADSWGIWAMFLTASISLVLLHFMISLAPEQQMNKNT